MTRPAGVITPGRHPFEIGAFSAMFLVGMLGLAGATSPAIERGLPSWFISVFYGVLAGWALVGLAGLSLADVELRLGVERLACYGVGWCALSYAVLAFVATGWAGATAALGLGWISPAATWRIRQIHLDLRQVREQEVLANRPADEALGG